MSKITRLIRRLIVAGVLLGSLCFIGSLSSAAREDAKAVEVDRGGARAADAAASNVGEVRVRTMAATRYAYVAVEQVTFDGLGDAIARVMPQMEKAIEQGTIKVKGPFVLTYPAGSAHRTTERPFTVHVGLLVSDDSTGGGDVKVRACEPFRAATVLYTGPVAGIGQCYQRIFPALDTLGLIATGEEREFTLYYESPESPNNVVLVQVGVRDAGNADKLGR